MAWGTPALPAPPPLLTLELRAESFDGDMGWKSNSQFHWDSKGVPQTAEFALPRNLLFDLPVQGLGLRPKVFPHLCFVFYNFGVHHEAWGILVPQPRIKPMLPAVEAQRLNHWTNREVPLISAFNCSWASKDLRPGFQVLSLRKPFCSCGHNRFQDYQELLSCSLSGHPCGPHIGLPEAWKRHMWAGAEERGKKVR